jgi:hypothetical protein
MPLMARTNFVLRRILGMFNYVSVPAIILDLHAEMDGHGRPFWSLVPAVATRSLRLRRFRDRTPSVYCAKF